VGGEDADGGRVSSVGETFSNRPATLADYLAILRRRKWIIVGLPVMAALVAYAVSTTQAPLYKAKSTVLANRTNIAAAIANITPDSAIGDPTRFLTTQASIARSPELAERVVDAAEVPGMTAGGFLGEASASPESDADILDLSVSDRNAAHATRLADVYAQEFTRFKTDRDTATINDALTSLRERLQSLRARGLTETPPFLTLSQYEGQLESIGKLLANSTSVLEPAEHATKVRPLPRRNAIIGGLLGAFLGLGLAFLAEALDRRVRSEEEIEEALGLPLLGRLPRPGRRLRNANKLVMLSEPQSVHAETFRRLRTSVEFVNFDRSARTIMVTSAGPREGKSTTVANLAVALARAGRRVALVDLDLRRPFLHSFFHTRGDHGITDVVVNRVALGSAIRPLTLPAGAALGKSRSRNGRPIASTEASGSNGRSEADGVLHFLPGGTIPPAADEFLESEGVARVLEDLSNQFDLVLVDAPPLLAVSDVMTLSTNIDAIVVVTHLGLHRRQLQELARQLRNCKAPILGFVVTGVSHGDSYSYGYGYDPHVYDVRQEAERRGERV
jgi:succinoglycan biosynthesis transport protein ExoP